MEEVEDEPTAATEPAYYYADGGKPALGPCTVSQLKVLWISGHIGQATCLWREGMSAWTAVLQLPEVYGTLSTLKQPPAPDSGPLWYYLDARGNSSRAGVPAVQMGALLRRGEVDGLTSVWREGMSAWAELGSVPELRAELQRDQAGDDDDDDEDRLAAMERMAAQVAYDPDGDFGGEVPSAKAASGTKAASGQCASAIGGDGASTAADADATAAEGGSSKPKRARKSGKFVSKAGANAYVSGLPEDVSVEELAECLKVAGVLKADPLSGAPRIKLYMDANGQAKGDALVSFLKPESVQLAVTLRDGFELRPGKVLAVQPAKFEKRDGGDAAAGDGSGGSGGGAKRLGKEEKALRKKQRLLEQKALSAWDAGLSGTGKRNSTAVLTGLFDQAAIAAAASDPDGGTAFYENLRDDIDAECRKAGHVEKVTVFEGSHQGAVAVKFRTADDAERCAAMMNDRAFGSATIQCEVYDGVSDYRAPEKRNPPPAPAAQPAGGVSSAVPAAAASAEDSEEKNLDAFGDWLEADSTDEELEPDGAADG